MKLKSGILGGMLIMLITAISVITLIVYGGITLFSNVESKNDERVKYVGTTIVFNDSVTVEVTGYSFINDQYTLSNSTIVDAAYLMSKINSNSNDTTP